MDALAGALGSPLLAGGLVIGALPEFAA